LHDSDLFQSILSCTANISPSKEAGGDPELQLALSTGYFNLPDQYIHLLYENSRKNLVSLLCAAPQVSFGASTGLTSKSGEWIFYGPWRCEDYSRTVPRASLAIPKYLCISSFYQ
jgi:hypothetical protein